MGDDAAHRCGNMVSAEDVNAATADGADAGESLGEEVDGAGEFVDDDVAVLDGVDGDDAAGDDFDVVADVRGEAVAALAVSNGECDEGGVLGTQACVVAGAVAPVVGVGLQRVELGEEAERALSVLVEGVGVFGGEEGFLRLEHGKSLSFRWSEHRSTQRRGERRD